MMTMTIMMTIELETTADITGVKEVNDSLQGNTEGDAMMMMMTMMMMTKVSSEKKGDVLRTK